ncbi:MAG TPA: site-2 protease family protein, partial [Burkholderiaceae bacterium]
SDEDIYENVAVALMDQRPLLLRVRAPDGAGERTLTLPLPSLGKTEIDADVFARLGLGVYVRPVLGRVQADGPAARAGLRKGDLVTAIDGHPIADRNELLQRIRGSAADGQAHPLQVQVLRAGEPVSLVVTPLVVADGDRHFGRVEAEVGEPPAQQLVRDGLGASLWFGVAQTWDRAGLQVRLFGRMLTGRMSVKNLSGPISIADAAEQSISHGFMDFVLFLAEISVGLGVLNLLPLPVLDGGRLLYYLFEGATGRPVSALWQTRLQIGGVLAILLLMSLALSNDVARHLGQQ